MSDIVHITQLTVLPPRPHDGHKGTFGRVLVIGGNEQMLGAPVLAATAAFRTGCGLVQIAVPKSILAACLTITPELIGLALDKSGDNPDLAAALEKADVIVIGPGLGQSRAASALLKKVIRLDKPMVVDADALNLLSMKKQWPASFKARAVLTPHPGEMTRLSNLFDAPVYAPDQETRIKIALAAAKSFRQVILLKGAGTIVTDGAHLYINKTGDSTLAKGGSGDVLSGIIASLMAQKLSPFDAAVLGAHLHGLAGQLAGQEKGQGFALARDVIDKIGAAMS